MGQEEDLDVELEIHKVAWESALLVEWDEEEAEGVEIVEVSVALGIVYAHHAEREFLIVRAAPATR